MMPTDEDRASASLRFEGEARRLTIRRPRLDRDGLFLFGRRYAAQTVTIEGAEWKAMARGRTIAVDVSNEYILYLRLDMTNAEPAAMSGASEVVQQEDGGGGSNRTRTSGWESAEEASAYYASIGPWVTAAAVMNDCNISEQTLKRWRENRLVLGVEFADGQFYYQSQQFVDGHPLPGLDRVLDVLKPAFVSPASQAGWFSGRAYYGDATTRWDMLRAGVVQLLVGWAEEDASRILGP